MARVSVPRYASIKSLQSAQAKSQEKKSQRRRSRKTSSQEKMKRSLDESEFDVSDMQVTKHARIHGVMTEISPMKDSKNGKSKYFNGKICDGKTSARFVCFDKKMHEKLSNITEKKQPLVLSNCEVKESKYSTGLEVVVRNTSEVLSSPKKMNVPDSMFAKTKGSLVTIEEVAQLSNYEVIAVQVKVLGEEEATEVKKGLIKQDYWIADASACCKIVTWEDNVGLLVVGESYKLSGLVVRTFNGKKYLSVQTEGFVATKIDDIGVVAEVPEEQATEKKFTGVSIVGVKSFETFDGCYSCSGKVVPRSEASPIGSCSRCGTLQRLDRCQESATARLDLDTGNEIITVAAFTDILKKICNARITLENLLCSEDFDAVISDRNVVVTVTRTYSTA